MIFLLFDYWCYLSLSYMNNYAIRTISLMFAESKSMNYKCLPLWDKVVPICTMSYPFTLKSSHRLLHCFCALRCMHVCISFVHLIKTGCWIAIKACNTSNLKQQKSKYKIQWPWHMDHADGQLGLNKGLGYLYIKIFIYNLIDLKNMQHQHFNITLSTQSYANIFHSIILYHASQA